jgi:GntP family gluconate:H+ symporter
VPAALAGLLWANRVRDAVPDGEGAEGLGGLEAAAEDVEALRARYGTLPGPAAAFAPIVVPILLICLGSVAALPAAPLGEGSARDVVAFVGQPLVALLVGLACALALVRRRDGGTRRQRFHDDVADGLTASAPILLITGAGGAFGAVIQASPIGDYLGESLSGLGIGVLMPFLVAAALKSAQGSSTVALVTTSALVAPLLGDIGMDSDLGRVLVVMAIGAGAMTVSHANDSFFWVVTQFSRMSVAQAYRAQTAATLLMGLTTAAVTWVLSLLLV